MQTGVHFVSPKDGQTVPETVQLQFAVDGKTVRPAGEDVYDQTSGHFHLLIDEPMGYTETGIVVGEDATHIHYGKGQTQATVTLSPGKHTLTLQFSDGAHKSYGKDWAQMITVTVGGSAQ